MMMFMNWNLLWNVFAVVFGAMAVYATTITPMVAIALSFLSGLVVALSARLDMALTLGDKRDEHHES